MEVSIPAFMQEESIKRKANKREKKVTQQLCSGAFDLYKGDMSTETDYIEHKYTDKDSYSLKKELCEKILDETCQMGKENGILIIEFKDYRVIGKVEKK
jgi:hypothetical protein